MNKQTAGRGGPLVDFLVSAFSEPVRDPLWGHVYLSPGLSRLLSSGPFARLSGIRQLGPAHLVYPGATHSRLAHSLGVFHLARRMALALALRGELGFASREGLASFLAAALAHDLGHFPYAHSLKELPLREHEALTSASLLAEPLRSLVGDSGADPQATAAIVDSGLPAGGREIEFFRGLLSGVLDPDKLDYLNRDAYYCGVPYGIQDADYILDRLRLLPSGRLGIEERALMSVEGILFSKYLMYRSIYWHRGVRAATAVVKKAVCVGLGEGLLRPEELYGLDDAGFRALIAAGSHPAFRQAARVLEGGLWPCLLELPFEEGREAQSRLLDLGERLRFEEDLARRAGEGGADSPYELVVDIPEPVSFESDLPVLEAGGEERAFSASSTVFSPAVVAGFSRSLRRIRLFAPRPSARLAELAREELREGPE